MAIVHEDLLPLMIIRPTDYADYGGQVKRWEDSQDEYPDCSCGCPFFAKLKGSLGADWGVCANPHAQRAGLLTFEHQAGYSCFQRKRPALTIGKET